MGRLLLAANVFADEGGEAAFGILAELVVMGGFFADHDASAVVAGVKPFCGWGDGATGAVEAHARAHFDKGPALRKVRGFLVFDAYQGEPLIVLENADGTDRHFIAGFGLADSAPVPGGENRQADNEHRRQDHGGKNDESFFQC